MVLGWCSCIFFLSLSSPSSCFFFLVRLRSFFFLGPRLDPLSLFSGCGRRTFLGFLLFRLFFCFSCTFELMLPFFRFFLEYFFFPPSVIALLSRLQTERDVPFRALSLLLRTVWGPKMSTSLPSEYYFNLCTFVLFLFRLGGFPPCSGSSAPSGVLVSFYAGACWLRGFVVSVSAGPMVVGFFPNLQRDNFCFHSLSSPFPP